LINYNQNVQSRIKITVVSATSPDPFDNAPQDISESRQDNVLSQFNDFWRESRLLRDLASLKPTGKTRMRQIHPLSWTKQSLRIAKLSKAESISKVEGIEAAKIQRRKTFGECLRCAWPAGRNVTPQLKDCFRPIKLDKGTARRPKNQGYQKQQPLGIEPSSDDNSEGETSSD
jgi:hypothetical protein